MSTSAKGIFTISLDFELHWGGFEKWPLEKYKAYFLNTRQTIPVMLDLFGKYEAHVTWAAVGMLFHNDYGSLRDNFPKLKPTYQKNELSAYHYIDTIGIGEDEERDPFHFAHSLIRRIQASPHQEIGSHTFAHYYCNEPGQTVEQFRDDLKAAVRAASAMGVGLRSLVFPRNQFNAEYLRVCYDEGIKSVRSNPKDWFWKIDSAFDESKWKRFSRGMDAYFGTGKKKTFSLGDITPVNQQPLCIPASRLLRPHSRKEGFLKSLKLAVIKKEMEQAARDKEVYHLWWHPHNFGWAPSENLIFLEQILTYFQEMKAQHQMESMTMGELAAHRAGL